jgi:hypothetical protein
MRQPLAGVAVRLDGTVTPSSTTIATVGGCVLVLATAAPRLLLTLTSCYLARSDGALAVSHLRLAIGGETFSQYVVAPAEEVHATLAGACLLDHAAALRDAAGQLIAARITVDVEPDTLDRVAQAWGPPPPPG